MARTYTAKSGKPCKIEALDHLPLDIIAAASKYHVSNDSDSDSASRDATAALTRKCMMSDPKAHSEMPPAPGLQLPKNDSKLAGDTPHSTLHSDCQGSSQGF